MRKFALLLLLAGSAVPAIAANGPRGERGDDGEKNRAERSERPARAERAQRPERAMARERSFEGRRQEVVPQRVEQSSDAQAGTFRRQMRERVRVQQSQVEAPRDVSAPPTNQVAPLGRRMRDAANNGWQPRDREIRTIPNTTPTVTTSGRRDRDGVSRHGGSHSRWTQNWRNDRRYDWRNHRNRHRTTFSLGFYYDPFGYSYRRYSIGSYMYPNYYRSSYWINDPWQYRLPPAYGPYRWVRYHNDALLIDTWSGEVVDVIYGFFW